MAAGDVCPKGREAKLPARPYWSGQLKISLVSFGIQLFPAVETRSGITFHQIDRSTGQRIHHLNVVDGHKPAEDSSIVKGYEYSKGKYVVVEPEEVAKLRIATKNIIAVKQFVEFEELSPTLFEKAYFVVPAPKESPEAFAVVHKAMEQTGKAAIGEVAFAGREHLVAIAAHPDRSSPGLMAYLLHYKEELRDDKAFSSQLQRVKSSSIDKQQLEMAVQLIKSYSHPFKLEEYKDDYEAALRELIEAKQKNAPLPLEEEQPRPVKVVSLMDALRNSLSESKHPTSTGKRVKPRSKRGPVLVGQTRRKHKAA